MKTFFPVLAAILLAGCAGTSPARLKTENLFRDDPVRTSKTVSDYDALVFKSGGSEIYGQILIPDRSFGDRRPCVLMFHGFAAITVISTPIAQELAFRHILYSLFSMFLYRKESAVVVSLIFALCHVSLMTMFHTKPFPWEMLVVPVVPLFLLALFLQQQYEKSKSVIPSILIHAGFNLISVFLLVLQVYYGAGK